MKLCKSILLIFLFVFPPSLYCKSNSSFYSILNDSSHFNSPYDHSIGVGLDLYSLYGLKSGFYWNINDPTFLAQFSYQYYFENITLRSGFGASPNLYLTKNSYKYSFIPVFRANIGVQKTLFFLLDFYTFKVSSDLFFLKRGESKGFGASLIFVNQIEIEPTFFLSFEVGGGYSYLFQKIPGTTVKYDDVATRPLTLSLHYRF
ncbi:MAG: hypothetical protein ABEH43_07730 [Flavobacteriales bacterium]